MLASRVARKAEMSLVGSFWMKPTVSATITLAKAWGGVGGEGAHDHTTIRPYVHTTILPCYNTTILPCLHTTILPYCHAAMLPYCHATILPYCHATILPYCHATILPYYHTTILPCYHTTDARLLPAGKPQPAHRRVERREELRGGAGGSSLTRVGKRFLPWEPKSLRA